jgi:hypothetical protein
MSTGSNFRIPAWPVMELKIYMYINLNYQFCTRNRVSFSHFALEPLDAMTSSLTTFIIGAKRSTRTNHVSSSSSDAAQITAIYCNIPSKLKKGRAARQIQAQIHDRTNSERLSIQYWRVRRASSDFHLDKVISLRNSITLVWVGK